MGDAGSYLLQVTAAGILSGIIKHLFGSKGMIGSAVKLLTGIFMTVIVTAPLLDIRIDSLFDGFDDIQADGIYAATQGENNAKEAMAEIITRQTQAYILDKAESLGAELTVTLYLTDDLPPVPCGAQISGKVSPYAKRILSEYMETELGISMEAQTWTG